MTVTTPNHLARGLVSYGPYSSGGWKLQDLVLRPLQEKEVLIEMVASGVCHTDLHCADAESGFGVHYPRVMGHEGELDSFCISRSHKEEQRKPNSEY